MNGDENPTHLLEILVAILPFITPSLLILFDTFNQFLTHKLRGLMTEPDRNKEPPSYLDMREEIEGWIEEEDLWENLITPDDK